MFAMYGVLSLCHVAMVHDTMLQLTGTAAKSSEQHEEIGKSRTKQNYRDCRKFLAWLTWRNPFLIPGMVSIRGKNDVNCERAEYVGKSLQTALDNTAYTNASIKRKDQVKTLESLKQNQTVSKAGEEMVDSQAMFNTMITVATREDNMEDFFYYEVTGEPMSLLKKWNDEESRQIILKESHNARRRSY